MKFLPELDARTLRSRGYPEGADPNIGRPAVGQSRPAAASAFDTGGYTDRRHVLTEEARWQS
jgi:hypothetical protein